MLKTPRLTNTRLTRHQKAYKRPEKALRPKQPRARRLHTLRITYCAKSRDAALSTDRETSSGVPLPVKLTHPLLLFTPRQLQTGLLQF